MKTVIVIGSENLGIRYSEKASADRSKGENI